MPSHKHQWSTGYHDPVTTLCEDLGVTCLENVPLAPRTTWKIGGPARWLVQPGTAHELQQVLRRLQELPEPIPRLVLGGGSNVLIDDVGFQGVVLDLKHRMNFIALAEQDKTGVLWVGAGTTTRTLAHFARTHGLTGAEFLGGIPGSVGGALRMNAGAYGQEMKNIVLDVELLDAEGVCQTLAVEQLGMSYRCTQVPQDWIFLSARLQLHQGDPETIRERMRSLNDARRTSQPLRFPSAGSTFKNPVNGPKAWQWIAEAGLRGVSVGDAQVSEKHCNFLINRGAARSCDMRLLMDRVQKQVVQVGGALLALEVEIVTAHK